jgi:hypothetical protein
MFLIVYAYPALFAATIQYNSNRSNVQLTHILEYLSCIDLPSHARRTRLFESTACLPIGSI